MTLALWAVLAAQDGGKLDWRGKGDAPRSAMADARRAGRAILLFFTSDG